MNENCKNEIKKQVILKIFKINKNMNSLQKKKIRPIHELMNDTSLPDIPFEIWDIIFAYSSSIPRRITNRLNDLILHNFPRDYICDMCISNLKDVKECSCAVFKKHIPPLIFKTIFENGGVVAGGAALFCVDDKIDLDAVGDIDIFFTADNADGLKKTLWGCIELLKQCFSNITYSYNRSLITIYPDGLSEDCEDYVHKHGSPISYQFILSKSLTTKGIISNFDMDYIQVAIDKNRVYRTDIQKKAQECRTVTMVHPDFRKRRLEKVYSKKYEFPKGINMLGNVLVGYNRYNSRRDYEFFNNDAEKSTAIVHYSKNGVWKEIRNKFVNLRHIRKHSVFYRNYPFADSLKTKGFTITKNPNDIPLENLKGITRESYEGDEGLYKESFPSFVNIRKFEYVNEKLKKLYEKHKGFEWCYARVEEYFFNEDYTNAIASLKSDVLKKTGVSTFDLGVDTMLNADEKLTARMCICRLNRIGWLVWGEHNMFDKIGIVLLWC